MNQKETKNPEQQAIHKWIFFGFNASSTQTNKMFADIAGQDYDPNYLREKYARHGYDMNRYYCECDSALRKRMVDWVMNNYHG